MVSFYKIFGVLILLIASFFFGHVYGELMLLDGKNSDNGVIKSISNKVITQASTLRGKY